MRVLTRRAFAVCLTMAAAVGCVTIARTVSSEHQACEILQHAAVEYRLTRTDLTGRYYCDPLPSRAAYYVLGLRYRTTPDELVGSNLIGWYAVAKRDGAVFAWDINDELPPAPLVPGPPFETH